MRPFRRGTTRQPPSAVAVGRLARDVDREVADLREGLADDLILALLLLENGEPEEAGHIVDVGSARLRRFHDQLERSVAAAAVERDAEEILAAAEDAPGDRPPTRHPLRTFASATAAAAALVAALLVVASPPSDGPQLLAGALGDGESEAAADDTGIRDALDHRFGAPADAPTASTTGLARADERMDVLRLFDDRRTALTRLGERRGGALAVLLGVERLVAGLLPTEPPSSLADKLEQIEGVGGPSDELWTAPIPMEDEAAEDEDAASDGSPSEPPTDEADTPPETDEAPTETPEEPSEGDQPSETPEEPSEEPTSAESEGGTQTADEDDPHPWSPGDAAEPTTADGSSGAEASPSPEDDGIF